jgi:hypothetical protein
MEKRNVKGQQLVDSIKCRHKQQQQAYDQTEMYYLHGQHHISQGILNNTSLLYCNAMSGGDGRRMGGGDWKLYVQLRNNINNRGMQLQGMVLCCGHAIVHIVDFTSGY